MSQPNPFEMITEMQFKSAARSAKEIARIMRRIADDAAREAERAELIVAQLENADLDARVPALDTRVGNLTSGLDAAYNDYIEKIGALEVLRTLKAIQGE